VLLNNKSTLDDVVEQGFSKNPGLGEYLSAAAEKGTRQPCPAVINTSAVRVGMGKERADVVTPEARAATSPAISGAYQTMQPQRRGYSTLRADDRSRRVSVEEPIHGKEHGMCKGRNPGTQDMGERRGAKDEMSSGSSDTQNPKRRSIRRKRGSDRDASEASGGLVYMLSVPLHSLFGSKSESPAARRHTARGRMGGDDAGDGFGCFPLAFSSDSSGPSRPWTRELDSSYAPEKCIRELSYAIECMAGCSVKRESVVMSPTGKVCTGSLIVLVRTRHGRLSLTVDISGTPAGASAREIKGSHVVFSTENPTSRVRDAARLSRIFEGVVERFAKARPGMRVLLEASPQLES
jgi:hypothetical protein